MIVSYKDSLKLIGISIVVFCAVFVCTFFINYYIDVRNLENLIIDEQTLALYNAQLSVAKFTSILSGGFLGVIAVIMLIFYIKLYIDQNASRLGILKAMGYSSGAISIRFAVFGLSVFVGAVLGYGCGFLMMPTVYEGMAIPQLPPPTITFHPVTLLFVFAPTVLFCGIAVLFAYFALKRPVYQLMRGKTQKISRKQIKDKEERGFLKDMCIKTVTSKKSLAFFVAFASFCFSAMVQMSISMNDLSAETFGWIILIIGIVLAVVTVFMSITSLIKNNIKNISIIKAFGYSLKECSLAILGGYHIFAAVGFAVGTVYQYGLLKLMVNLVFKDVGSVPEYNFSVSAFFITLASFLVFYEGVMLFYTYRMSKISVKEVMSEN